MGLIYVGTRVHQKIVAVKFDRVTRLVAYQPVEVEPQRPAVARVLVPSKVQVKSKPAITPPAIAPIIVAPQVRAVAMHRPAEPEPTAPEIKLESKKLALPATATSSVVAVGTFSHESPVTAPVVKLADTAQPGVFDGHGQGAQTRQAANVGITGAFDSGSGSGQGNGTRAGTPRVVASAGFGNGALEAFSGPTSHKAGSQPNSGASTPVEITFKPKPAYTDEGRKRGINGEVRLEVLFKSDGQVQVVKVVQGLGYGLDEQAVKAAQQIKFKPASRGGQAIDSLAQVHIIFELIS